MPNTENVYLLFVTFCLKNINKQKKHNSIIEFILDRVYLEYIRYDHP